MAGFRLRERASRVAWSSDETDTAQRSYWRGILLSVTLPEGWSEVDGALEREFRFDGFLPAVGFVNRVAELAEAAHHHPDIAIHYNRVTLRWSTHSAGGITDRDHELAARTSELA